MNLSTLLQLAQVIAVDFDGTLCSNAWPGIGKPNRRLIELLIDRKRDRGVKLILWTCRDGALLEEAVRWCEEQGLTFDAVNANLPERIEAYGCDCRKVSADLYIDDRAVSMLWGGRFECLGTNQSTS